MVELKIQNYEENCKKYSKLKELLTELLGSDISISHVGSTAVPDMVGKNIIDILIGASNIENFEKYSLILKNNGYFEGKNATQIYKFFASTENETKGGDVHIHLVMKNAERYDEFLILKNYLLNNKQERDNYSNFKKEILVKTTDRKEYRQIKSEYVSNLLKKARQN